MTGETYGVLESTYMTPDEAYTAALARGLIPVATGTDFTIWMWDTFGDNRGQVWINASMGETGTNLAAITTAICRRGGLDYSDVNATAIGSDTVLGYGINK